MPQDVHSWNLDPALLSDDELDGELISLGLDYKNKDKKEKETLVQEHRPPINPAEDLGVDPGPPLP